MSQPLDCNSFLQLVQLVLDGEASEEQVAQFKEHLKTSQSCLETYKDQKESISLIRDNICKEPTPCDLAKEVRELICKTLNS